MILSVISFSSMNLGVYANTTQLSPQIGLPIEEAKANPNVVLVVTSFGGHLGWFQQDGSRWFIQAVCTRHLVMKHESLLTMKRYTIPYNNSGKKLTIIDRSKNQMPTIRAN